MSYRFACSYCGAGSWCAGATISGHRTRAVFDRYNIVNLADLREAGHRLQTYMEARRAEADSRTASHTGEGGCHTLVTQ
jgi:hypothetical protein